MLSTCPVEVPAIAVFDMLTSVPLVSDDVVKLIAVCVESVPHSHVWAKLLLSMVLIASAEVRAESALLAPPVQPVQPPVMVTLLSVVVPLIAALPLISTLPLK